MTQKLRALAIHAEDLDLALSTLMVANNHLQLQLQGIYHPLLAPAGTTYMCVYTFIHVGKTHTHKINFFKKKMHMVAQSFNSCI